MFHRAATAGLSNVTSISAFTLGEENISTEAGRKQDKKNTRKEFRKKTKDDKQEYPEFAFCTMRAGIWSLHLTR